MNKLDEKIKNFGNFFYGRLDDELLQDAIAYVDYDERGLAFETICDHICEYDINISQEEYDLAMSICKDLEMNENDAGIRYLKNLIKTNKSI